VIAPVTGGEVNGPLPTDVLQLLTEGDLRALGLLPRASNYTFLAEVSSGTRGALAVYKPRAGEQPLWDFPDGTLCNREVAAYLLARALGWPPVPPTVLRDGPHGPGSVQLFIEADQREHYFTLSQVDPSPFRAIAAFDVAANNADRKGGHCLVDAHGTVWVVDHGVCFSAQPKLRTVIWEFGGEPLPSELGRDLERVAGELRSGPLRTAMLGLLTTKEVDATARRAQTLAQDGCYPQPRSGRSYPWPPV
jgi:hypothetical protein